MRTETKFKMHSIFSIAVLACLLFTTESFGQRIVIDPENTKYAGEFDVAVDKSQVLRIDQNFTDVLIGNPEIADVLALSDRTIYVLGKETGSTSITIYGPKKVLIAVIDLNVTVDIDGLKSRFNDVMPGEAIEVRPANDGIVLSGLVSSAPKLQKAIEIARQYVDGDDLITNLMNVSGSQQVMLAVRFSEVARNVVKDIGVSTSFGNDDFRVISGNAFANPLELGEDLDFNPLSLLLPGFGSAADAFGGVGINGDIGSVDLNLIFDALERTGVVKTLAEPNLIALSGDTASFLAGGEFPVPIAQNTAGGSSTITVEFREFGVSLSFTPTVLENGLINLVVEPEVSRIDRQTAPVILQGFNIPGLVTRKASTTVELRDGQSFAIAGLIQSDFIDTIEQFPVLGDIPILGALFRSAGFQNNETELVIIVTPHLVRAAPAEALVVPADFFIPPSDSDIFLFGRTEAPDSGKAVRPAAASLDLRNAGGIEGSFGHIIR